MNESTKFFFGLEIETCLKPYEQKDIYNEIRKNIFQAYNVFIKYLNQLSDFDFYNLVPNNYFGRNTDDQLSEIWSSYISSNPVSSKIFLNKIYQNSGLYDNNFLRDFLQENYNVKKNRPKTKQEYIELLDQIVKQSEKLINEKNYINYLSTERYFAIIEQILKEIWKIPKINNYFTYDKNDNYATWTIDKDISIQCKDGFQPVEIVSKIYQYSLEDLTDIINKVSIFKHNFSINQNTSQGFHMNISFENQNIITNTEETITVITKFLHAWWFFEDIIFSLLPRNRQFSTFAISLRNRFIQIENLDKTLNDIKNTSKDFKENSSWNKYTAVNIKNNRFEIRCIDMNLLDPKHIPIWITFLISFLNASIKKETINDEFCKQINNNNVFEYLEKKFSCLFDFIEIPVNFIKKKDLIEYFSEKIKLNLIQVCYDIVIDKNTIECQTIN